VEKLTDKQFEKQTQMDYLLRIELAIDLLSGAVVIHLAQLGQIGCHVELTATLVLIAPQGIENIQQRLRVHGSAGSVEQTGAVFHWISSVQLPAPRASQQHQLALATPAQQSAKTKHFIWDQ
jgi:hypothetical protein